MMRAMILAAGRGERMRPLTDHTPKPLLPVAGRPLIEWHLCKLAHAGFHDIVVNNAWLGEQVQSYVGDGSRWNLRIHHSHEPQALETAGGIAQALEWLGPEPFLVINGDVWSDWDVRQAFTTAEAMQAHPQQLASLVLVPNPPQHPMGDFLLTAENLVQDRPSMPDSTTKTYTFSGIGVYQPKLFSHIQKGQAAALAPLLRQAMQHQQVIGSLHCGPWHDIGTVERLQQLDQALRRSTTPI